VPVLAMAKDQHLSELLVDRASIGMVEANTANLASIGADHVRVEVERWALTANTMTYAKFGDFLGYWDFFPTAARPGWGKVPAIGYGKVAASNVEGVDVGSRYFCWFPQATSIDLAVSPSASGFRDDGAHRAQHATPYRQFLRTDLDSNYTTPEDEDRHLLLRGLFITGFLIDAYFATRSQLGAEQALVLSASSKTALGYASAVRSAGDRPIKLVGITSTGNLEWTAKTGLYDHVYTYDELDKIDASPSVVIDMAGASAAVAAIHGRLDSLIAHSMIVGNSHHDAPPAAVVGGPTPELFFAPTAMVDGEAAWGREGFGQRTKTGVANFIEQSRSWLSIERIGGVDAAADAWRRLHAGQVGPETGMIVSLV
jgi:hypothetical protein